MPSKIGHKRVRAEPTEEEEKEEPPTKAPRKEIAMVECTLMIHGPQKNVYFQYRTLDKVLNDDKRGSSYRYSGRITKPGHETECFHRKSCKELEEMTGMKLAALRGYAALSDQPMVAMAGKGEFKMLVGDIEGLLFEFKDELLDNIGGSLKTINKKIGKGFNHVSALLVDGFE